MLYVSYGMNKLTLKFTKSSKGLRRVKIILKEEKRILKKKGGYFYQIYQDVKNNRAGLPWWRSG